MKKLQEQTPSVINTNGHKQHDKFNLIRSLDETNVKFDSFVKIIYLFPQLIIYLKQLCF